MPEPTKIPRPFADSGDKNAIPDSSGSIGFASWQEGFPAITSEPFAQGGVAPKRADFNGIFNALSLATVWQQQGGFYAYDVTTDYEVGNVVEYNNDLYKCLSANGPSSAVKAPTDTTVWSKVMTAADVAAAYLPTSTISTGTWTPVLYGSTTEGTFTYAARNGEYVKIGNMCYISFYLRTSAIGTAPAGNVRIKGIPFNGATTVGGGNGVFSSISNNSFRRINGGIVEGSYISLWANNSDNAYYKDTAIWGSASDKTGYKVYETTIPLYFYGWYKTT